MTRINKSGFFITLLLLLSFFFIGCDNPNKLNSDPTADTATPTPAPTEADTVFNTETKTTLNSSVINIPASLLSNSAPTMKMHKRRRLNNTSAQPSGDQEMSGIYTGITGYISMAEEVKNMVKEIMGNIVGNPFLTNLPLDTIIDISDPNSTANDPTRLKIEKPVGSDYEWKLSLFFTTADLNPEMIINFTVLNAGAKGRLLMDLQDEDTRLTQANITGVNKTAKVDVIFDGTSVIKTLEIKFVQDLSEYRTYATNNWSTLSQLQKSALDLGQPEKLLLKAIFDGYVFTISGTSYHPGSIVESNLNNENSPWGNGRTMYMFKAKTVEDATVNGAKLALALPLETTTDITNVWLNDSISTIASNSLINNLNTSLTLWINEINEPDTEGDVTADGTSDMSVALEKQRAYYTMLIVLGDAVKPPSIIDHGLDFTKVEYDAAQAFDPTDSWGIFSTFTNETSLSTWFKTLDETTSPKQSDVYNYILGYLINQNIVTHGYSLTKNELENFLNIPSNDPDVDNFKTLYYSLKYMVNPAFYNSTGFLGTLDTAGTVDTTDDVFYKYTNTSGLEATSDTSSISGITNLDLRNIVSYTPKSVYDATIDIK